VLDSVGMIQARFLEEFLEVVSGRSCLALVVAHVVFGTGATRLLVDVTVVVGCGLLTALFLPLLAGLNALLDALDGDARRRFHATVGGWLKLGRLSAGGVRGGDIAPSFSGASRDVGRHAERPRLCSAMSTTLGHSDHRPLRVEVIPPSSAGLVTAQVPPALFGSRALLPECQGLVMQALLP
jgi:hypothetical protein